MKNKERVYHCGPQQDENWHNLKLGKFSASDIYYLFKEPKTKIQKEFYFFAKTAINYIDQKAGDLLYQEPVIFCGSKATEWGNFYEPYARRAFKEKYLIFQDSGEKKLSFVEILDEGAGVSPDDTIDWRVPIEYKCPENRKNHLHHLKIKSAEDLRKYSKEYFYQVFFQMFVLDSEHGFWCSYDDRLNGTSGSHNSIHAIELKMTNEIYDGFCERIPKAVALRDALLKEYTL